MFSIKQAIADTDLDPYQFEDATGAIRTLPHLKTLSVHQLQRLLADGEVVEVLTEAEADPEVVEQIPTWPSHVLDPFMRDWMAHSDVRSPGGEPGKSTPPSPPSPSTAARSKRTSRSAGSTSRR